MIKFISLSLLLTLLYVSVLAQDTTVVPLLTPVPAVTPAPAGISNRSNDHFMLQLGYDGWQTSPDTLKPDGLSRSFNIYFMLNKPLKGSRRLSAGLGLGFGSTNMFFDKTYVDLKSAASRLPFRPFVTGTDSANFNKFKITAIYAEIPLELRWAANPQNPQSGFRAAVGAKVGALVKAYSKGKDLQSKSGTTLYGNTFIEKEQSRRFLNSYRVAATMRLSYGIFGIYGQYHLLNFLKDGAGPDIRPYSAGITISGL